MLPQPEIPVSTGGHVLLLEEYAALATAFTASLRRAAPDHEVSFVTSLSEAETAIRERVPQLLVIDVDPTPHGLLAFFKRLQSVAPDLRVLVVGAEDAGDLPEESNGPAVLRFIKKPFQMAEFIATVRELLGAGAASAACAVRHLELIDLLVLHAVAAANVSLQINASDGRSGEIHFADGRISHALVVGLMGAAALPVLLGWRNTRVRELHRHLDAPRTIRGPWTTVLREALRAVPFAAEAASEEMAPLAPPAPPSLPATKILVVDDTELLLVFVEEILASVEPRLQVVTAASGLRGYESAVAENPELILLDYSLPDINGAEVCERLLANEATAQIPVIMMSGHVPEMVAVAERCENVVAAIPKPFLSAALIELIERTLADLPALAERRRAQAKSKRAAAKEAESKKRTGRKSRNGNRNDKGAEQPAPAAQPETLPVEPPTVEVAKPTPPPPEPKPEIVPEPLAVPAFEPASRAITSAPDLPPEMISAEAKNAVVATLPLEIVSIQFSPALKMKAIRARPSSSAVTLHVLPAAAADRIIPEATFDLARVQLDARGQIDTIHVAPTTQKNPPLAAQSVVPMAGLAILTASGDPTMEFVTAPAAAMRMQLTALFQLAGVELSPGFRVAHLVLRSYGGTLRVSFDAAAGQAGVKFEAAQILLDRSGRIAEVLLDSVVAPPPR
ncbi:MAG: response regulator [Verrucomicrobiota bacterium]|nr:response regulator [Verrucomicrobiota bacterium]